jgi:hypothetical protein
MIKYLLLIVLLFAGCTSLPLPNYAEQTIQSVNYVQKLNYDGWAFAYSDKYDIYIKKFTFSTKILLVISGLNEDGVYLHEAAHVFDYYMFMNKSRVWSDFNMKHYGHVDFYDYTRRERFAEDCRRTLQLGLKNDFWDYLNGR